jgi:hypothetical protein
MTPVPSSAYALEESRFTHRNELFVIDSVIVSDEPAVSSLGAS